MIVLAEGLAEYLPMEHHQGRAPRRARPHRRGGGQASSAPCDLIEQGRYADRTNGRKRRLRGLQLGYEARCAKPTAFDAMLGSQLGVGAYRALAEQGLDGVMVSLKGQLELCYVPFEELVDPDHAGDRRPAHRAGQRLPPPGTVPGDPVELLRQVPQLQRIDHIVVASGRGQDLAVRRNGDRIDGDVVGSPGGPQAARLRVPQANPLVVAGRGDRPVRPARKPGRRQDRRGPTGRPPPVLLRFPQPDRFVLAGRRQERSVGRKRQPIDIAGVPGQHAHQPARRRLPQPNRLVPAAGGQQARRRPSGENASP